MIVSLLINTAINTGSLAIEESRTEIRLVTKKLGATVVLARLSKEDVYQLHRTPEMPETLAEAEELAKEHNASQRAATADYEHVGALASDPVPLPVKSKPKLTLVTGGVE